MTDEAMNLKENREGYITRIEGGKRRKNVVMIR